MDKKKLDDLPKSDDKYWEHAEVHTNIVPHNVLSEDGHFFERVTGRQARCKHCHWGFELDPGDYIEDGHLYTKDKELVI